MSPDGMIQWLKAFNDLSDDELDKTFDRASMELKEFPSPAAVRQFAGSVALDDKNRATIAWNKTREAIRRVGGYATVSFDDPIITATIRDLGGWTYLCDRTTEELDKLKWDFWKSYESISKSGLGDGSPLPGICETTNAKLGYGPQNEPQRIETGLPLHPVASDIRCVEREAMRLENKAASAVAGALVDRMRQVEANKPDPPPKDVERDVLNERAKLLAAYPSAGQSQNGAAAS